VSVARRRGAKSSKDDGTADATPLKSWPNLGYDRLPALDYLVLEITSEDLRVGRKRLGRAVQPFGPWVGAPAAAIIGSLGYANVGVTGIP
jgi:hypothetical protein